MNSKSILCRHESQNLTYMGRKLYHVRRDLLPLEKQGKVKGFFKNTENSGQLSGLVEDIRDAMMEYQVCIRNPSTSSTFDTRPRPQYSKASTTRVVSSL